MYVPSQNKTTLAIKETPNLEHVADVFVWVQKQNLTPPLLLRVAETALTAIKSIVHTHFHLKNSRFLFKYYII
jgi:hypothetical protein